MNLGLQTIGLIIINMIANHVMPDDSISSYMIFVIIIIIAINLADFILIKFLSSKDDE